MGKPMTKSLEMLIGLTAMKMAEVKPGEVCSKCRDDRICEWCPFNSHPISSPPILHTNSPDNPINWASQKSLKGKCMADREIGPHTSK